MINMPLKNALLRNRIYSNVLGISTLVILNGATVGHSAVLEEIVVTAQKRAESIQDVPLSITAISGDKIEKAGVESLAEMSAYIPNLTISEGAINTNIYMRGVGSGINRAFEQSVGMFVDGIYMGRGKQFRAPFLDLDRAEVLRGPQGVLFGKNTIAGSINLTTARAVAGGDFDAKVTVDFEPEYNAQGVTAVVETGLTDTLGVRMAAKSSSSDGYMHNRNTDRDEQSNDEDVVRLSLNWEPNDYLNIHAKAEHTKFSTKGTTAQIIGFEPLDGLAGFVGGIVAPTIDPGFEADGDLENSTDEGIRPERRSVKTDNFALNIDYALGEGTLTLVAGYSAYDSLLVQDVDFLPVNFINTADMEDFEQTSLEIRYATSGDNKFDYITGVYYQESELDFDFYSTVDVTQVFPALHAAFSAQDASLLNPAIPAGIYSWTDLGIIPENFGRTTNFKQKTDSLSAFFQGTYNVTDDFRIIAGGRYTAETKDVVRRSMNTTADSGLYRTAESIGPAGGLGSPGFNSYISMVALKVAVTDPEGGGSRDERQLIPSLKFQYDINDSVMAYGSVEKGFKSGGFNANADATDQNNEFNEEKALGLELGFKSDLLDGSARLNGAIFRTNFKDLQVTTWNGFGFEVGNAAESVTQGIELDGTYLLSYNITLSGSMAYLDSYYEDYAGGPCSAVDQSAGFSQCDLTDKSTPFAPEFSSALFIDYVTPIGRAMEFSAQLSLNYVGDLFIDSDLDENLMQEAHTKLNMRIALASDEGTWDVALIGKNLTDERTFGAGLDVPLVKGGYMGYTDTPRTLALQATVRF